MGWRRVWGVSRVYCGLFGHDYPEDGTISQQCARCGDWWNRYDPFP